MFNLNNGLLGNKESPKRRLGNASKKQKVPAIIIIIYCGWWTY